MPVTKQEVKRLEQERPVANVELHYTIGGDTEAIVHSNLNAEGEAAITIGARRLNTASEHLHRRFDSAKPDARTEYMRQQPQAARHQSQTKAQNR